MTLLGLDIGGANIKAATADGEAVSVPFELWKTPEKLAEKLVEVVGMFPPADHVGVTMTGELCDCFETKAEGVVHIVDVCLNVFAESKLLFWLVDDGFADAATAKVLPRKTAASNWHALASYVGTLYPDEDVLLVDIGSTTTDIIPIRMGKPATTGKTDEERLALSELIYMGIGRTPVGMFEIFVPFPFCREYFASTLDCLLVMDIMPEQPENRNTADNRPATKHYARNRLARMLGGDITTISHEKTWGLAESIVFGMQETIFMMCVSHSEAGRSIVVSGGGEFLTRQALTKERGGAELADSQIVSLSEKLGTRVSEAAPAYAVAQLLKKHLNQ